MSDITTKELIKRTGITEHQVYYWTPYVIQPSNEMRGSGYPRRWNENHVPIIRLLVKLSSYYTRNVSVDVLKKVYDNYYNGRVEIADGVFLTWPVEVR